MVNVDETTLSKASKFGGYEKRQVLSYIQSIRESYEYTVSQLEKKNTELEAANSDLTARLDSNDKKLAMMENRLYEEQNRVGNLNITINDLNLELASQRVIINERDRQLNELRNQSGEVEERMRALAAKAKKFDDLKENVGAIMLEAKANAGNIIERAQLKSRDIVKEAENKLIAINHDISALRHQLAMGRKFLLDLTKTISDKLDNMDIVVNSIDHSVNYDVALDSSTAKLQALLESFDDQEDGASTTDDLRAEVMDD